MFPKATATIIAILALSAIIGAAMCVPHVAAAPTMQIDAAGIYVLTDAIASNATVVVPAGSITTATLTVSNTASQNGTLLVKVNGATVSTGTLPAGNDTAISLTTANALISGHSNLFAITLTNATGANLTHTNWLWVWMDVDISITNITHTAQNASAAGEVWVTSFKAAPLGNHSAYFVNISISVSGLISAQAASYKGMPTFPTVDVDTIELSIPQMDANGGSVEVMYTVSATGWYAWGQYVILAIIIMIAVVGIAYFALKVR